jgi:hypothetical protein
MSKYNAKKTEYNGKMYSSKKEAKRAKELHILANAGHIAELREQVVYILAPSVVIQGRKRPPIRYVADFEYMDMKKPIWDRLIVEDCKGFRTPVYNLKRHLMKCVHGIDIFET